MVGSCLIIGLLSGAAADDSVRDSSLNYDFTAYIDWLDYLLRENEIPGERKNHILVTIAPTWLTHCRDFSEFVFNAFIADAIIKQI